MDSSAPFAVAAKHLFRRLHDPRALRKNPLVRRFFEDPTIASAGQSREAAVLARLHQIVREGADRSRDADLAAGKDERALRQHAIVTLQCIEQRSIRDVAATLGISCAHCYRERAEICRKVARYVAEHDDAPALEYFSEVDEFRFLIDRTAHRAAFGEVDAALRESDELLRVAPTAQQKIEALRLSAVLSAQLGDATRAEGAYAQARALWAEHLAGDPSVNREVARARIDLMELELAYHAGNMARIRRSAQSAVSRLEPIQANSPPHVREMYVESRFNLGLALANEGNLERGCEYVEDAETILGGIRRASPQLRSWIAVEAWRLRNRLVMSSVHWRPFSQRATGLATAFELAYGSGALSAAVQALIGLTEHHAFAGNDAEALRAARSAVLLAKQHSKGSIVANTSMAVVRPLLSTRYWRDGLALIPSATQLDAADTYHRDVILYCNAMRALKMRAYDDARALARSATGERAYPALAVRTRLIAATAAHGLQRRREACTLIEETLAAAEGQNSAPMLREAYGVASMITGDPQFNRRAREIARLLTA